MPFDLSQLQGSGASMQDIQLALGLMNSRTQPAIAPVQNPSLQNIPRVWPQSVDPLANKLAVATGQVDPNYADPRAKLNDVANQTIQAQQKAFEDTQWQRSIHDAHEAGAAWAPQIGADGKLNNPGQYLAGQVAGDSSGTVASVLRSLQKGDPTHDPLQPYLPTAGYGKVDLDRNIMNPLDHTIYSDPTFQNELQRNPDKAKFAYQRLTGRDLTEDLKANQDFRKKQNDTGYGYAQQALARGAKYDPVRKTWQVWNDANAPEGGIGSLQAPRPFSQLIDASDYQNQQLNAHYKNLTGKDLPVMQPQVASAIVRSAEFEKDPIAKAAIDAAAKSTGITLTPESKIAVAMKARADHEQSIQQGQGGMDWTTPFRVAHNTVRAIAGYKPLPDNAQPENAFNMGQYTDDPSNRNWLGRLLDSLKNTPASGALDPLGRPIARKGGLD